MTSKKIKKQLLRHQIRQQDEVDAEAAIAGHNHLKSCSSDLEQVLSKTLNMNVKETLMSSITTSSERLIHEFIVEDAHRMEFYRDDPTLYKDPDQPSVVASTEVFENAQAFQTFTEHFFMKACSDGLFGSLFNFETVMKLSTFGGLSFIGCNAKLENILSNAPVSFKIEGMSHEMEAFLEGELSPRDIYHLVERRETYFRYSPLFLVIQGYKVSRSKLFNKMPLVIGKKTLLVQEPIQLPKQQFELNHVKALIVLLEYGANPNARDLMGCTPLFHIWDRESDFDDTLLVMGMMLLAHGADINATNRYEETLLSRISQSTPTTKEQHRSTIKACHFLLNHTANFEDLNFEYIRSFNPHLFRMHSYFSSVKAKKNTCCVFCNQQAQMQCSSCGKPYCSAHCQKQDWKDHKIYCKDTHVEVVVDVKDMQAACCYNHHTKEVPTMEILKKYPIKEKFILKLVVSNHTDSATYFCHDKHGDISVHILPSCVDRSKLMEIVKQKGILQFKGFFSAYWTKTTENTLQLHVEIHEMAIPREW